MSRPRSSVGYPVKDEHSMSLKVLRLSKPSLSEQSPLPHHSSANIPHMASLAYPSRSADQDFLLTPILTFPPAFGSAYVGETFSCALCANNELTSASKTVSGLKMSADMTTPTQKYPLQLIRHPGVPEMMFEVAPKSSMQRIIHFDLKEEGNHTLSVDTSYAEIIYSDGAAPVERTRTLRKMYQFQAQPCFNVRTKSTELAPTEVADTTQGSRKRPQLLKYVLEAQLENVSSTRLILRRADFRAEQPFGARSLNDDVADGDNIDQGAKYLNPGDVLQVAFLVEQQEGTGQGVNQLKKDLKQDGRIVLGQIALQWRSEMGEKGELSTGNLMTRRKQ